MIEMRMRDQHQINRRQVLQPYPWFPEALQDEQPASEVGVDHNILLADLHEEASMANKRKPELPVSNQFGLVHLPGARSDRRVPDEPGKLAGPAA